MNILGSQFEASLRIALLLEAANNETLTEGAIAALDYVTVYSHDFGISASNLHGESKYRFSEFTSRRATIRTAIRQLVLDGLVEATCSPSGFHYKLSSDGIDFASSLDTEYADAYFETAMQAIAHVGKSERTLGEKINHTVIASIRED